MYIISFPPNQIFTTAAVATTISSENPTKRSAKWMEGILNETIFERWQKSLQAATPTYNTARGTTNFTGIGKRSDKSNQHYNHVAW